MSEIPLLIQRWAGRAKLQHSFSLVALGLAIGLGAALALALAARLVPLVHQSTLILFSVGSALSGASIAWLLPWVRTARRPLLSWARLFDQQFHLHDRLSTCLELREGLLTVADERLRQRLRDDAEQIAQATNARITALLPLRLNRRDTLIALALLATLVLVHALPNPQERVLLEREQFRQNLSEQLQQLAEAEQIIEQSKLPEAQRQALREALAQARQTLQGPDVTPAEALAALNALEAQIEDLHAALNTDQAAQQLEALRRAGERLSPNDLLTPLAEALRRGDWDRAADLLRNLIREGGDNLRELSEAELQQLVEQLEQMAQSVEASNPTLAEHLRQSAESLRNGDAQAAQQNLQQAAAQLERAAQARSSAAALDNLQRQVENTQSRLVQGLPSASANSAGLRAQPQDNAARSPAPGRANSSNSTALQSTSASGGKSDDVGSDRSVYAPSRIHAPGVDVTLPDTNSALSPDQQGRASLAPPGRSSVPYESVYREYAQIADEALNNTAIPASAREYVRSYFSALDPQNERQP
ncbi:MAG: hypothetical protein ACK4WM_04310 [Thermoflexales bacterium]